MKNKLILVLIVIIVIGGFITNWFYNREIGKIRKANIALKGETIADVDTTFRATVMELTDDVTRLTNKHKDLLDELDARGTEIISLNETIINLETELEGLTEIEVTDGDTLLRINVEDRGIGMNAFINCRTKEYQAKLFLKDIKIYTYLAEEGGVFVTYSGIEQWNLQKIVTHTTFSTKFFEDLYDQRWYDKISIDATLGAGYTSVLGKLGIGFDKHSIGLYGFFTDEDRTHKGVYYTRRFFPFR